ncbi:MAG: serine hydrolase domain-containing protein [Bacteroidales bacterium]|jgi:D-alanyl-D-alanine carboxypeptidase|nr:serine hydrolase domain-containing protein [Bacteroidales bacterium]
MNLKLLYIGFAVVVLFTNFKSRNNNQSENTISFQKELDEQVNENMPGISVSVITNDKNFYINWNGASGLSDVENGVKLLPDQTFRIASVTKTFVAATILRLWEDGKIKLEDPISKYISEEHVSILKTGSYNPEEITVYHLLTHSSGLSDHTQSLKYEFDYLKLNHIWSRTEQLNDLVNYTKPVGKIGEKFSYSDTGYILLGEIIETITNKSLGEAIIEQLKLKKLGLSNIYMEDFKGDYSNKRIHQYIKNEDTYFINPSLDYYGGGGLLANSYDLSLFFQYLFEHKIFHNESTLSKMLSPVNYQSKQSLDYRVGIWETEINGMTAYTHTGFWGTQVIYIPEIKTSIAVNYSQKWKTKNFAPIIPIIVEKILQMKSENNHL